MNRLAWVVILPLILVVLVFAALRVTTDLPNVTSGTLPDPADFEFRYAAYPWLAYAHIAPGVTYLCLAPIQLWRGVRNRHLGWHRRIGRVALVAGILSASFGILFGLRLAFGGPIESSAAVVFGTWFLVSLTTAYRSIRRGDVRRHRRWMIRAFAIGLAVGTIRIWVGLFEALGILSFRDGFGLAFWLGFGMHAAAAELWLIWRPWPSSDRALRPSRATA